MPKNIANTKNRITRLFSTGLTALALLAGFAPSLTFAANSTAKQAEQPQPNATCPSGGQCFADVSASNPFYAFVNRIYGQNLVTGYTCGGPGEPCDANNRPYYRPGGNVTRQQMAKFIDNARHLPGIDIQINDSNSIPIIARNDAGTAMAVQSVSGQALSVQSQSQLAIYAQTGNAPAIYGFSTGGSSGVGVQGYGETGVKGNSTGDGTGIYGTSDAGIGVLGVSPNAFGHGVVGDSSAGVGVYGRTDTGVAVIGRGLGSTGQGVAGYSDGGSGVYGESQSGTGVGGFSDTGHAVFGISSAGWAGYFQGNVDVTGTCCAMGEAYTRIDDPIDPANKYLNQSLVQSPEMTTVVNGNTALDSKGEAVVALPAWFQASTRDFRYILTAVGAPGPNLYIAHELADNLFKIAGGSPGGKVSWQVTGIRQDPYATAHLIPVEQDKPPSEQGTYLHPTELGQPELLGVDHESGLQAARNSDK